MTPPLAFSKYQGTGNDFVMVFDPDDAEPLKPEAVADLCDRRFGVGADGPATNLPASPLSRYLSRKALPTVISVFMSASRNWVF